MLRPVLRARKDGLLRPATSSRRPGWRSRANVRARQKTIALRMRSPIVCAPSPPSRCSRSLSVPNFEVLRAASRHPRATLMIKQQHVDKIACVRQPEPITGGAFLTWPGYYCSPYSALRRSQGVSGPFPSTDRAKMRNFGSKPLIFQESALDGRLLGRHSI